MKINKTEKEFRDALRPAVSQLGSHPLEQRLDAVISALELEFQEELSGLPDRLAVRPSVRTGEPRFIAVYSDRHDYILPKKALEEVYLEAAACYNVIKSLHRLAGSDFSVFWGMLVVEERRKLREGQ